MGDAATGKATLTAQLHNARKVARTWAGAGSPRGEKDPRHVVVEAGRDLFLLTGPLLAALQTARAAKGAKLSDGEMRRLAVADTEGAVYERFTSDAINAINASYYAAQRAFAEESMLANIYGQLISLNYTIGGLLAQAARHGKLRVKELASSTLQDHWQFAMEGMRHNGVAQLELTLSDFVPRTVGKALARYDDITAATEVYNLFDDLPSLPAARRYDVLVATYGFDSVWLPEDIRLLKEGDTWYKATYRLKVDIWNRRHSELIAVLQSGKPLPKSRPRDYEGIFVELLYKKYDLEGHPYAKYIRRSGLHVLNFPGGMLRRVMQAFDAQLAPDGIFVIGDISDLGMVMAPEVSPSSVTGVAARYKTEAYSIAVRILEDHGFSVTVLSFADLARRYLPDGWEAQVTAEERFYMRGTEGNNLLVIERKKGVS